MRAVPTRRKRAYHVSAPRLWYILPYNVSNMDTSEVFRSICNSHLVMINCVIVIFKSDTTCFFNYITLFIINQFMVNVQCMEYNLVFEIII